MYYKIQEKLKVIQLKWSIRILSVKLQIIHISQFTIAKTFFFFSFYQFFESSIQINIEIEISFIRAHYFREKKKDYLLQNPLMKCQFFLFHSSSKIQVSIYS